MNDEQFFLGRQPIIGRSGELVAYELLFRSGTANHAEIADDMAASAAVIEHAFLDLGVDAALGDKLGFINVSEGMLLHPMIESLPPRRVVLELLETVPVTPEVCRRCAALKQAGYRLAIDDVTSLERGHAALLPLIDIVKIDVHGMSDDTLRGLARELKPYKVALLGEKIDQISHYNLCWEQGFSLFQGYYFARPTVLSGRKVPPSTLVLIKLFGLLAADAEIRELEAALKRTPELTLRMLKLVNSAAFYTGRKISTLRNAIVVLGRVQLNRLIQVMMFAQQHRGRPGTDPLIHATVVRGRLMELLAEARGLLGMRGRAFMTGILSLADVLFAQDMEEIIRLLNLQDEIKAALRAHEGELGALLALVKFGEQADPGPVEAALHNLGLPGLDWFNRLQLEAMKWSSDL
jgi:EAL and modified HD-GYP domain-containing signal transduction protein